MHSNADRVTSTVSSRRLQDCRPGSLSVPAEVRSLSARRASVRALRFARILLGFVGGCTLTCAGRSEASDSGAWQLVDPWLRPRERLAMAYDSLRGVTVMFGGFVHYAQTDVHLRDTWEYDGRRWVRKSTEGPSPRFWPAMAYDSRRGVTVLFGGGTYDGRYTRFNDTWEWDGVEWSLRATSGPTARYAAAMAYDEHRGVVVLYGGNQEGKRGDMWEWDGQSWVDNQAGSHIRMSDPHMVYDSARRVLTLTGLGQTWEFNGAEWLERQDSPGGSYAAMVYDSARGVTVMHRAENTWEWDGQDWILVATEDDVEVLRHGMAYDSRRRKTVLFGGDCPTGECDNTWEWDGQAWALRSTAPLSRTSQPAMAYDAVRGQTLLLGGYRLPSRDDLTHTFAWNGRHWSLAATEGPMSDRRSRSYHAFTFDVRRETGLLFGGEDGRSTWEWDGRDWTWLTDTGPPERTSQVMVYDRARGVVVLFGGSDGRLLGDTWEWDGSEWTLASREGPSPRSSHAMAYDTAREVTVLFGGRTEHDGSSRETWEWDGQRWTLMATGGPWPRTSHAMAYDEDRHVTVLYGGSWLGGYLSDTWEWNGIAWRPRQVEGAPRRSSHSMVYDSQRRRMVLFGGWGDYGAHLGDTWEFDPCVGLSKLRARCKAGTARVMVNTSLPRGSTVPVDNNGERQDVRVNASGRAKGRWREQSGEHTLFAVDCPRLRRVVDCSP